MFQLGGLGSLFGGLSPPNPRGNGTVTAQTEAFI